MLATTSISSGALYTTNATSTNFVTTTLSTGSLNTTTVVSSTVTTGSLLATTSISSGALYTTNATSTNFVTTTLSTGSLNTTTVVSSTVTTGSLLATTSISSGALYTTNATSTNFVTTTLSTGSLNTTTVVSSTVTTASLLATTSISSGALSATNSTITNIVATATSSASLNVTNTISTNSIRAISNTNTLGSLITTAGNIGIGTTSPAYTLDVNGTARFTGAINIATSQPNVFTNRSISSNSNYGMYFCASNPYQASYCFGNGDASTGYVTINDRNGICLYVNGVLSGGSAYGEIGTVVPCIDGSIGRMLRGGGYIEFTSNVGAIGVNYFTSDIRKKENIIPCTLMCSDIIDNIEFINFDWGPNSGMTGNEKVGFSAQQLQQIDEKLVNELSDGGLMVDQPGLLVRLAKSLQEQIRINKQQQTTIENLKQFLQSKFPGEI